MLLGTLMMQQNVFMVSFWLGGGFRTYEQPYY